MIGRVVALGLVGWSGIVALAWNLADARIALCGSSYYSENAACIVRTTGARDFVLVFGLTVGLVVMLAVAFLWVRHGGSISVNWRWR